jgi:antitoxin FitA
MKQLITRVDEDLHRRLKEKAAAEGRSVNALVVESLEKAVGAPVNQRAELRRRLQREGVLATPARRIGRPAPPSHGEVRAALQENRDAVLEALDWARGPK